MRSSILLGTAAKLASFLHSDKFPVSTAPKRKKLPSVLRSAWLLLLLLAGCVATDPAHSLNEGKADGFASAESCMRHGDAVITGQVKDRDATEISGLVMSRRNPERLWAHNDGDGKNLELFSLKRDGSGFHEFKIRGVSLTDVEDIAIGPGPDPSLDYLYLADTGDNPNDRKEVQVIRLPEPSLDGDEQILQNQVETFRFEYDDDDPHDAEALMVDPRTGDIIIITKHGPDERHTRVYQSRPNLDPTGINILDEVLRDEDASWLKGSAVAADISADGNKIAILFKDEATRTWERKPGESVVDVLRRPACQSPSAPGQQEALAFTPDGRGFYLIPEGRRPNIYFVAERLACADFDNPRPRETVLSPVVEEVSGLAISNRNPDVLWAVNDSGKGETRNILTALTTNGEHIADTELVGIQNHDWEDIAVGPGPGFGLSYVYIADIGDNDAQRGNVQVHRFLEPAPGEAPVSIDTFRFEYPGDDAEDAESLLVDPITGDLYIISRKRHGNTATHVYRAQPPFSTEEKIALTEVFSEEDNSDLSQSIVGADIRADGLQIALLRRDGVPLLFERHPDGPVFEALSYRGCRAIGAVGKHDAIALDASGGFFQLGEGISPTLFHSAPL